MKFFNSIFEDIYRKKFSREFYKKDGEKILKHLQFSIIPFYFQDDYYLTVIVEEITDIVRPEDLDKAFVFSTVLLNTF